MKKDMAIKIEQLVKLGPKLDEHQTRSLMILIRKELESMSNTETVQFSMLSLFCNWSAHPKITQSLTGLKTLARINDALVRVKQAADNNTILTEMTKAIGFNDLRSELSSFLKYIDINETISDYTWKIFLDNLIEIIRDVPLSFPLTRELRPPERKIYKQIADNAIKPGAGVVMMVLSRIDYGKLGAKNVGEILCLLVRTEDTTTIVVPLLIAI
jgi:hypothetical protein